MEFFSTKILKLHNYPKLHPYKADKGNYFIYTLFTVASKNKEKRRERSFISFNAHEGNQGFVYTGDTKKKARSFAVRRACMKEMKTFFFFGITYLEQHVFSQTCVNNWSTLVNKKIIQIDKSKTPLASFCVWEFKSQG